MTTTNYPKYLVKYSPNHSDEVKYIVTTDCYTANEASDYAAMFFNADYIHEVKQLSEQDLKEQAWRN